MQPLLVPLVGPLRVTLALPQLSLSESASRELALLVRLLLRLTSLLVLVVPLLLWSRELALSRGVAFLAPILPALVWVEAPFALTRKDMARQPEVSVLQPWNLVPVPPLVVWWLLTLRSWRLVVRVVDRLPLKRVWLLPHLDSVWPQSLQLQESWLEPLASEP